MNSFLEFFVATFRDDLLFQSCTLSIGVLFLWGAIAEFRLSRRYRIQLAPWRSIEKNIQKNEIPLSIIGIQLVERFFIVTEWTEHHARLAKTANKSLINQSLRECLPGLPTSPHRFFPALLTSIGVLGTFSGITLGLSEFNTSGDSAAMMTSASGLLSGMKSAFWTSIIGLLSGALFMLVLWRCQSGRQRSFNQLYEPLMEKTLNLSPTALLYGMSPESQKEAIQQQLHAAEAMARSNETLSGTLIELKASISDISAERLSESISGAINDVIIKELRPPLSEIPQSLSKLDEIPDLIRELKEIKEDNNQKLIEFLVKRLQEDVISPVMEQTEKTAVAVEASTKSVNSLSDSVDRVIDRLGETTDVLDQFQKSTLSRLEDFASSLRDILAEFHRDTEASLNKISGSISHAMESAETGMAAQRDAFEESAKKATASFESQNTTLQTIGQEVTSMMNNTLKSVDEAIKTSMDAAVSGLDSQRETFEASAGRAVASFETQNQTLKSVGDQASALMNDAKSNLLDGLGSIDDKIKSMSSAVQAELEVFRKEYQENLEVFFRQQETMLEDTLGQQRDGLISVVDKFKQTFEEENEARTIQLQQIVSINQQLSESTQKVKDLVQVIGLTESAIFDQLESAARSVSAQVGKLQSTYEQAQKSFTSLSQELPEAMDQYFTKANAHSDKFFANFDDASFRVHSELADAANLLVTAMQQINLLKSKNSEVGR